MDYDFTYELEDLLNDERLISSIMTENPMFSREEIKHRIELNYEKCKSFRKPKPIKSSDHQPCNECGGIDFMRTGTCFVCMTCGLSQGCS